MRQPMELHCDYAMPHFRKQVMEKTGVVDGTP